MGATDRRRANGLGSEIRHIRELRTEKWAAHEQVHHDDRVVREKLDKQFNDVRTKFVDRDVYTAQRQADQRLMVALLGLIVVLWAASLGAVVALAR